MTPGQMSMGGKGGQGAPLAALQVCDISQDA
jgi:hypothetical protein